MAKDQAKSDITDLARRTQALFKLNGREAPQFENVAKVQEGIVEEIENFARNWFQRRHDASQSVFKALNEANAGKVDPAAAIQAMTEWQRGSFERLSADMQDWTALCLRCADAALTVRSDMASDGAEPDGSEKTNSKSATGAAEKADGKNSAKSKSAGHATHV